MTTVIHIDDKELNSYSMYTTSALGALQEGDIIVPNDMVLPDSFPFMVVETVVMDGVLFATYIKPYLVYLEKLKAEEKAKKQPTEMEDLSSILVDQEYRLTLLELGGELRCFTGR